KRVWGGGRKAVSAWLRYSSHQVDHASHRWRCSELRGRQLTEGGGKSPPANSPPLSLRPDLGQAHGSRLGQSFPPLLEHFRGRRLAAALGGRRGGGPRGPVAAPPDPLSHPPQAPLFGLQIPGSVFEHV